MNLVGTLPHGPQIVKLQTKYRTYLCRYLLEKYVATEFHQTNQPMVLIVTDKDPGLG
jgi:hypothetical protein